MLLPDCLCNAFMTLHEQGCLCQAEPRFVVQLLQAVRGCAAVDRSGITFIPLHEQETPIQVELGLVLQPF